jgi:acetyltransferase
MKALPPIQARRKFRDASIPTYESPTDAVKGFFYLWQHTKAQEELMRTPPRETERARVAEEAARSIMRVAATAGRKLLTEPEAKAVLSAYGIPTVTTRVAARPEDVERIARDLLQREQSVAIKILSEDISHKSDVGGVKLGLRSVKMPAPPPSGCRTTRSSLVLRRVCKASPCSP